MDAAEAPAAAMAVDPVAVAAAPEPVAAVPEGAEAAAKATGVEAPATASNGSSDRGAGPTAAPAAEAPEAPVAASAAKHIDDEDDEDGGLRIAAPGDKEKEEVEDTGDMENLFGSDDEDEAGPAGAAGAAGAAPAPDGAAPEEVALQDSGNEASRYAPHASRAVERSTSGLTTVPASLWAFLARQGAAHRGARRSRPAASAHIARHQGPSM